MERAFVLDVQVYSKIILSFNLHLEFVFVFVFLVSWRCVCSTREHFGDVYVRKWLNSLNLFKFVYVDNEWGELCRTQIHSILLHTHTWKYSIEMLIAYKLTSLSRQDWLCNFFHLFERFVIRHCVSISFSNIQRMWCILRNQKTHRQRKCAQTSWSNSDQMRKRLKLQPFSLVRRSLFIHLKTLYLVA